MEVEPRSEGRSASDPITALVLATLLTAFYRLAFQDRMLDDGAGLATMFAQGKDYALHFLYLPACRLVAFFTPGGDPIGPTKLLSALAAGLGCAFSYLVARRFGAGPFAAVAATLILAFSPALRFFGTTVEVHALHFLMVSFAAWVTLIAPWERPGLALALTAIAYALAFLAHQLAVLAGPGWVLLVHYARSRKAEPFAGRILLLVVGPALALALLVAQTAANLLRFGSVLPSAERELKVLSIFQRAEAWFFWDGFLLPLFLLVPVLALALPRARSDRLGLWTLVALIVVPTAFLFWWGVAERGGYFLGSGPFLVALAAFAFGAYARRGLVAVVAILLVQAGVSQGLVTAFDRGWKVEERVEQVRRLLGENGLFVSSVDNAPKISVYLPGVEEVSLWSDVATAHAAGIMPESFVPWYLPKAEAEIARHGGALLELAFLGQEDRPVVSRRLAYYEPLIAAIEERFETRRVDHPFWPMMVIEEKE